MMGVEKREKLQGKAVNQSNEQKITFLKKQWTFNFFSLQFRKSQVATDQNGNVVFNAKL